VTSPTYFTSAIRFMSDASAARGDYTCVVCESGTTQTDTVAISYDTGRAQFSHVACLTSAGIAVSDDSRARQKAQHKAKAAVKAAKSLSRAQAAPAAAQGAPAPIAGGAPAPDESVPVNEAALREQIEAEYDELLGQAIDRLQTMSALIESLQAENRRLVAARAGASAPPAAAETAPASKPRCQTCNKMAAADGYCKNHRPTEGTVHISTSEIADQHLCRVCQKPARKDADTCKLHQFAAPEGTSKPAEPVTLRPTEGTFEAKFVALAPGNAFVRLIEPGMMCGQYGNPCAYLLADGGVLKAFQGIAPESRVQVHLKGAKITTVKVVKDSKAA
jgi:hypothetical protein